MSHQSVSPEQWRSFRAAHDRGSEFEAPVVSLAPFGAFLEVSPGIHGLLPKSPTADDPAVGTTLRVRILDLDDTNHRLSLARA
ncbi:S1 RNA-binding domain-containing protein [Nocardia transvalensis]|uniref:S1 RNA-binding domain-containing protein n=1 Tax=Nocardia transvalensis TaxID=37333 RepID=UPI0018932E72|nr:S1 RNA-binding domain-containing protein [Nocardia transvalensis]MBF6331009.1 S1 RNA-binding domain-containing protein [Nocardia transvalensis]